MVHAKHDVMRLMLAAALAVALAAAAAAQDRVEREPASPWRASALALVPAGYVAGDAYRTDGQTGYLALYPAGADDPKTPGSVFTPRQVLVVKLADDKAVSAALKPRTDATRGNRDTTESDPDGVELEHAATQEKLAATRALLPAGTEPCALTNCS